MARTLFDNVAILDGSGAEPFPGRVLIEDNRIRSVMPAAAREPIRDAQVIDGSGATLMPGLIESHAHLSFTDIVAGPDLGAIPPEEHTLRTAHYARVLLEHGFTSCLSAASAKPRLDIAVRNAIDAGDIPGPRMLAASPELTVTSGLGDARLSHLYRESFATVCDGADQFRKVAREMCREGVDTLKINPSGDTFLPHSRSQQSAGSACSRSGCAGVRRASEGRRAASSTRPYH